MIYSVERYYAAPLVTNVECAGGALTFDTYDAIKLQVRGESLGGGGGATGARVRGGGALPPPASPAAYPLARCTPPRPPRSPQPPLFAPRVFHPPSTFRPPVSAPLVHPPRLP